MNPDTYRDYMATGQVRGFRETDQFYRLIPKNFIVSKKGGYISAEAFKNTTGTLEMSVDWEVLCTAAESMDRRAERAVGRFYKPICDEQGQEPVHAPDNQSEVPNVAHCNIVGDKSAEAVRQAFAEASQIVLSPPGWAVPASVLGSLDE